MANVIELFGKQVPMKDNICNSSGQFEEGKYMRYNLYISITDVCLASCPFCNNSTKKKTTHSEKEFDIEKLKIVLRELKRNKLLNRVSITGGEPLLDVDLLNSVLNAVFEECGQWQYVTINTNGFNLHQIFKLDKLDKIAGIHISRHHYLDEKNDDVFGFKTAHLEDIKEVMNKLEDKKLLRLNTLLIKGLIDNKEEICKYLDMAAKQDIFRVGFVGLMPLNDFSKDHFVEYKELFKDFSERGVTVKEFHNLDICDCINGIYMTEEGKLVEFYARNVRNLCPSTIGQLSYTYDNKLCAGFGNVIF